MAWLNKSRNTASHSRISAISPILLGVMIDKEFGLTGLMLVLIIISAYPVIAAIVNFNVLAHE